MGWSKWAATVGGVPHDRIDHRRSLSGHCLRNRLLGVAAVKVLAASIAASLLGFVGMWCLHYRDAIEKWAGIDPEFWKVGGTD